MNQTNTVMLAIFVALGVVLVAGLIVIPAHAKISPVCLDPPACTTTQNQNPAGNPPHGHNK